MPDMSMAIGGFGVALLLIAFVLNVIGRLTTSWAYIWMNFVGSGLAATASFMIDFLPFLILEGVWFGAAGIRLIQLAINRADSEPGATNTSSE